MEVPLLGPEDLSPDGMAAVAADVLGCPVRYQQVPFEAFKAQLLGRGISESFAQGYVDMMRAKDEGMDSRRSTAGLTSFIVIFRTATDWTRMLPA